jgi:phosphoadenosine phosphosulfate reductase
MLNESDLQSLNERFARRSAVEILRWAWERFGPRAAIGTSFQGAGLVIMHLAKEHGLGFPMFTIDTGLLFPETLALKDRLEEALGCAIETLAPDFTVAQQAAVLGPELWQRDPDLCCTQRKVLPLRSKLAQLDCWITGLRREQSATRNGIGIIELYLFDKAAGRELVKLNPLADWSRSAVWEYVRRTGLPYNPLHDRGYRSIGCQPCTGRTGDGQNERAGRWTGFGKTECGLHTFMPKKQ